jgi:hypothetical protein
LKDWQYDLIQCLMPFGLPMLLLEKAIERSDTTTEKAIAALTEKIDAEIKDCQEAFDDGSVEYGYWIDALNWVKDKLLKAKGARTK